MYWNLAPIRVQNKRSRGEGEAGGCALERHHYTVIEKKKGKVWKFGELFRQDGAPREKRQGGLGRGKAPKLCIACGHLHAR